MSFLIKNKISIIRVATLTVGAIFITFGILRGELTEILQKAIVVCLECIGIG